MTRSRAPTVIGVAERVDLPDWGISRLRAKIDTGARTSALHVLGIEELGDDTVRFTIVLHRDKHDERVPVVAKVVRRARVRSSSGRSHERIFVATRVVIGGVEREVEISLASRRRMVFRMLLGRSALADAFLVDPGRRYVASAPTPPRPDGAARRGATSAKRAAKKEKVARAKGKAREPGRSRRSAP